MKRFALYSPWFISLLFISLLTPATAFGQKTCQFNIVGTWKAANADAVNPVLYRFASDGTVTALTISGGEQSSQLQEVASATYSFDDVKSPKLIRLQTTKEGGGFAQGTTILKITAFDETSFTCTNSDSATMRWVKVDSNRYFIVLAGRKGMFYDRSGPAFPMLIRMDSARTQVDAVGIYSIRGSAAFGTVPAETYNQFMKEPANASDVMLRLEISGVQYDRGLQILRTWERRVREGTLLYPDVSMDNILLVKQITESLNQCAERVKLYNLDWGVDDKISDNTKPTHIPFLYFKELKRLNQSLHVGDEKFHQQKRPEQRPLER